MHKIFALGRRFSAHGLLRRFGRTLLATVALASLLPTAQALPSYARQTGSECASCHVGGYGPQLTPYGIRFKINGYTDSDGGEGKIPLSAMMVVNATQTAKNAPQNDQIAHFKTNDNVAMQEASLFVAGKLAENIGSFVQVTYSGVDHAMALDQADVRYARSLKLGDKDMTVGLSLNSNPTLTDPFNTLGQWRFPYTSSDFNAGFGPSPMVENLAGGVWGANAYAFLDDSLYAEFGLYNDLNRKALNLFNTDDLGKFKGVGTYGRLAYFKDRKRDNFSVGLIGFSADIQPDRTQLGTPDKYRDLGIDASYQFLGNRKHVFTANASYIREWQTLNFTLAGAPDTHYNLDQFRVAASYHYDQTWGGTVGLFDSRGNANAAYNAAVLGGASLNNRPNTRGYILQADWTPWGKEGSWGAPYANVRLGVQYTGYNRFMGGSSYTDSDGNQRQARDNNTLMLFLWTSI